MKKPYLAFFLIVICSPVLFLIYLKHDLVCAPRAITASSIFGTVPLLLLTTAIFKENLKFFYCSLFVLAIEIIITPVIMLKRLGWEKLINERLLAFFTFEGIAVIHIILTILLLSDFLKSRNIISED
ncbi:MAG: hypothetical protein JW837_03185 [Sedimentisphaerales bacterium]|nr:hypothetical protein [Sedimentisphaerales bacterium]